MGTRRPRPPRPPSQAPAVTGFPTFVVGVAPDWDTAAVGVLNQMAVNGNQALQGSGDTLYDQPSALSVVLSFNRRRPAAA